MDDMTTRRRPESAAMGPGEDQLGPLAAATMASVTAYFAECDHRPSAAHLAALADIPRTLEAMADGSCEQRIYLSAIDCGIGKSTTTTHFARHLVHSAEHRDIGMLICVGRISEAEAVARALVDVRASVAVLTGDDDANALGAFDRQDTGSAQILVTTQQRIEAITRNRQFADVVSFHYRGRPRQVRCWDEAFQAGHTVTLNGDDAAFMLKALRRLCPVARQAMWDFFGSLEQAEHGQLVDIPDWEGLYGVGMQPLLHAIAGRRGKLRDDQYDIVAATFALAGKTARAWRDNLEGSVILEYLDTYPSDFAPLLVLDASGRVRHTYTDMIQHRGIHRLREATKDYSPLCVHWWPVSGSKSGWELNAETLITGITATINAEPDEDWLVVVHQQDHRVPHVEREVRRGLSRDTNTKVSFISWGNHMASNDYAAVSRVCLAGTLFMRPSYYASLTHLSQNRPTAGGFATTEEIGRTERGEHSHLLLQSICRGRVRRSDGDRCQPMHAYVIASPRSGIGAALHDVFPGCQVLPWSPLGRPQGKLGDAIAFVEKGVGQGRDHVSYRDIQAAASVVSKDFSRDITRKPEWMSMMERLGLQPNRPKRANALVRRPS